LEAADQAALDAVRAASPFEPFPESITYEVIAIRMEFNYVVNPGETTPTVEGNPEADNATNSTPTE